MSNVSIIKNSFFQRVFSLSRAITVDDKQKVLDDLCKEDSNKFFDEFKKLMASKNKIPEKNNITQKNINILITSCGYDIGITASITVAIIYHLSKINKSTSLDVAFITENLNKYLNLSKHNVNQVINYIDQMKKNINPKYTSKIYLNESIVLNNYIIEYPEELQSQEEYFSENNEYREDNLNYRIIFDNESNYNFLSNENSISNFKKVNMMNNIQSIKNHLKTYHSTKNLTWKENKQKASLAIYNYINKELQKIKINSKKDTKEEKERKTVGIKK
ncbi:MAG TPA: hypothetical protein PKD00_05070 [Burkholderiales bacterium]|nr:hypothetical protein [Burkholderiales bacterium]